MTTNHVMSYWPALEEKNEESDCQMWRLNYTKQAMSSEILIFKIKNNVLFPVRLDFRAPIVKWLVKSSV